MSEMVPDRGKVTIDYLLEIWVAISESVVENIKKGEVITMTSFLVYKKIHYLWSGKWQRQSYYMGYLYEVQSTSLKTTRGAL